MFYDMEHTISNLEGEIATLSNNNKKLEEELEAKNKIIEGQKNVFKKVKIILEDKAMGFNGAYNLYIKSSKNIKNCFLIFFKITWRTIFHNRKSLVDIF